MICVMMVAYYDSGFREVVYYAKPRARGKNISKNLQILFIIRDQKRFTRSSSTDIQESLDNPPVSLGSHKSDELMKTVQLEAVYAMVAESVGGTLNDEDWHEMAILPEWLALQDNARHTVVELAMKHDTQIFRILARGQ